MPMAMPSRRLSRLSAALRSGRLGPGWGWQTRPRGAGVALAAAGRRADHAEQDAVRGKKIDLSPVLAYAIIELHFVAGQTRIAAREVSLCRSNRRDLSFGCGPLTPLHLRQGDACRREARLSGGGRAFDRAGAQASLRASGEEGGP